jgi:cell division protein ZapA (FtsZ GTPase activity inhibitor)
MSQSAAQTVRVEIFNQIYAIRAQDGDVERTQALATKVDKHMREIAQQLATADSLKVAILAALHIAAELNQSNIRFEELNRDLAARSSECVEVLDQVLKANR